VSRNKDSKNRGFKPPGNCLRCGVKVSQEGVCCNDCRAVDSRRCKELSEAWRIRYAAKRERDMLLDGLSLHGREKGEYDRRRKTAS
jgi:hypothetical protein